MVNNKDLKILSHLRRDSRATLTYMSKRTGIPTSTLFDRVRAQERGLIRRYTTLINFHELGYRTRAEIIIRAPASCKDGLAAFLCRHPSVNSLFKLSNEYDFLAEGVFRTRAELELFLQGLVEEFQGTEALVYPILNDVKREGFLTDPQISEHFTLP